MQNCVGVTLSCKPSGKVAANHDNILHDEDVYNVSNSMLMEELYRVRHEIRACERNILRYMKKR